MLFSLKTLLAISLPLTSALTERDLETAYHAQTRVLSLLQGRQVTTTPCAQVQAPATCASSCGPGYITCPGGSAKDCYDPAKRVCCGDGSTSLYPSLPPSVPMKYSSFSAYRVDYLATCPLGTICNMSNLTCDDSGTSPNPPTTYKTSKTSTSTSTSTHKATTSKTSTTTTYYASPTFIAPTSPIDVTSSVSFFTSSAIVDASGAVSSAPSRGLGYNSTKTISATGGGATSSSSGIEIVQSNDGHRGSVEGRFFGAVAVMVAGWLVL
ncbi:hypothetical protein FKW77_007907 [Venturia effusa]|uniref:Uncharacterized protein n=1 Tax=Venturia effusa TaxID=50376 RepID=A0A517L9M7_9PEZI|nr:hypothetical protein FKW77_007907 [Venturia effusa]